MFTIGAMNRIILHPRSAGIVRQSGWMLVGTAAGVAGSTGSSSSSDACVTGGLWMPLPSTISITACEKGKGGFFGWGRSGDSSKTQEGASAVGDDDNRNETGANVADDAKKLLGLPDNNSNINNHNNSFFAGSPDWMGLDGVAKVLGEKAQDAIDSGIPTQLSYGFISGYCSGMALKKIGKAAAGIFGLGFIVLQTLSYHGYVHIDHVKVKKRIHGMMDLNEDGKIDVNDAAIAYERIKEVLEFGLPSGSGFACGFVGGLRS